MLIHNLQQEVSTMTGQRISCKQQQYKKGYCRYKYAYVSGDKYCTTFSLNSVYPWN
jgi:hypothetical protein